MFASAPELCRVETSHQLLLLCNTARTLLCSDDFKLFRRGSIVNCIACRYAIDDGVFHNKNTRPQESKLSYSREITRWNIFVKRGNVTCRGERQLRGLETIAVDDVKF
ncbi:predicted protein [Histoplasma capsulatum var. duboisii H88]|uniref:Predicted protein n=1 Tax=Ajellomyces capsulatus (strain H88) TaxID=544711 RepID=F0UE27_AJEC8|nr:predicted protein [Histoplasma capsulatum var. duboisii H88]